MLMRFCLISKSWNKKGSGLTDFFSILVFMLIILIFYTLFKFTLGKSTFELPVQSSNVQDSISLLGILRTPLNVDNSQPSVAELIAISKTDSSKNSVLEKSLIKLMDDSFGTSSCSMICISGAKIQGSGCRLLSTYICSSSTILIPGYDSAPIEVSFQSSMEELQGRQSPLK